ncbi:flagellar hook-associated protein FlgL [Paraliobacillus sediminis]|uniref:flagellar hook-associated protein FlgL n=1 Tax=Paraliobacillus sediminis TaxID=1885916 RepID=UPI000E3DD488|nr:flagellar hook-associated protein FlgL [Paraliobacillus sediminis]
MRVTQNMLSNNMLRNLSNSYSNLDKYMEQLSTGKKISRPSQDPVVAMKGMGYRSEVSNVEQYQRNVSEVHNWLDNSDASLDETNQALQKLRELTVQASNDTYGEEERANIAAEVDQLKLQLEGIKNTKVNDKYLFNGTNTTEEPPAGGFDAATPETTNDVLIEVSTGTKLKVNVSGEDIFSKELFDDIDALSTALKSGTTGEDLDDYISTIDGHVDNVINERADVGARMNRVDLIEDRLANQEIAAKSMMSDNEDADIEKVIINLTAQESVHRAALSAGSRVIQPTLLDFLR